MKLSIVLNAKLLIRVVCVCVCLSVCRIRYVVVARTPYMLSFVHTKTSFLWIHAGLKLGLVERKEATEREYANIIATF